MDELQRQFRVADMMLTGMSVLRDRYRVRAVSLDVALLLVTLVLTATVLVDEQLLRSLGIDLSYVRVVLAVLSVLATLFALLQWRVDWKAEAERYGAGASLLARLKTDLREGLRRSSPREEGPVVELDGLLARASAEMQKVPAIPDEQFLAIKAYHYRKVECSKLASRYPGAPMFVIRLRVLLRHTKLLMKDQEPRADPNGKKTDSKGPQP